MKTQLLLYQEIKKLIITKFKIYFINLEIIKEEKLYIFLKSKNLCNMMSHLAQL